MLSTVLTKVVERKKPNVLSANLDGAYAVSQKHKTCVVSSERRKNGK